MGIRRIARSRGAGAPTIAVMETFTRADPTRLRHSPQDALRFAAVVGGRPRQVLLTRATLQRWLPVAGNSLGLLRAYEQHKGEIEQAVQRRLALIGPRDADEVQPTDFVDWFVPAQALPAACGRLAPVYCASGA